MSKELVEYLRKPFVLQESNMGGVIDQMMGKMTEAADEIERLNGIIDNLAEALETAMDFIESNVADPDLTPEMWSHYRKLDHLEPRSLLALSKAHKVKE